MIRKSFFRYAGDLAGWLPVATLVVFAAGCSKHPTRPGGGGGSGGSVQPAPDPVANFTANRTGGDVPFTVTFKNLSQKALTWRGGFWGGMCATFSESLPRFSRVC